MPLAAALSQWVGCMAASAVECRVAGYRRQGPTHTCAGPTSTLARLLFRFCGPDYLSAGRSLCREGWAVVCCALIFYCGTSA
jgi:hypothetical protein